MIKELTTYAQDELERLQRAVKDDFILLNYINHILARYRNTEFISIEFSFMEALRDPNSKMTTTIIQNIKLDLLLVENFMAATEQVDNSQRYHLEALTKLVAKILHQEYQQIRREFYLNQLI